jgi:hypothetical protein
VDDQSRSRVQKALVIETNSLSSADPSYEAPATCEFCKKKKNRMELLTFLKQNLSLVDLPLSGLFYPNVVSFSSSWNESDTRKVVKSAYGIGDYFPLSWGFYRGDRRGN